MPDITLPILRRRSRSSAALRDLMPQEIQKTLGANLKSIADAGLARVELPSAEEVMKGAERASKQVQQTSREVSTQAATQLGRASRQLSEAVATQAARRLDREPRARRRSRLPFALIGLLGGLVAGWMLATSPTASARIRGTIDDLQRRAGTWLGDLTGGARTDELDIPSGEVPPALPSDGDSGSNGHEQSDWDRRTPVGVGPGRSEGDVSS